MTAAVGQRRTVHFEGQVQGVGFRATVYSLAIHRQVGGFVQNLPDGRVLAVAEGEAAELDALVSDIEDQMSGYIRDRTIDTGSATGEFDGFQIRY